LAAFILIPEPFSILACSIVNFGYIVGLRWQEGNLVEKGDTLAADIRDGSFVVKWAVGEIGTLEALRKLVFGSSFGLWSCLGKR
jgi:hypothetical protein